MTKQNTRPPRGPTLKSIAEMTGLSVTAVSRALKDAPDIGEKTKEQVRRAAQSVGYRPSRAGQQLRTGKSQIISLILDVEEEIMGLTSQLVNGISRRLSTTNYHLIVTPILHDSDVLAPVKYIVETGFADAIILSRTEPDDRRVHYLQKHNIPFVTHGRTKIAKPHAWADYDNERFSYNAVYRANQLGAKRIYLLGPPQQFTYGLHLSHGYQKALNELNLPACSHAKINSEDPLHVIENDIFNLMSGQNAPDAIISAAGSAAMAAVAGIEKAGLEVGTDVQVLSKQSTHILKRFRPAIEVFHEDVSGIGWKLADFALRALDGEAPQNLKYCGYDGAMEQD